MNIMNIDIEQQGVIEHLEILHVAMGRAIAARNFVAVLESTGDMELLAGKAAQNARVSAELQCEPERSPCACDARKEAAEHV